MKRTVWLTLIACAALFSVRTGWAGVPESGNTLALDIVSSKKPEIKQKYIKRAINNLYYFRYLKITEMQEGETNGLKYVKIKTVEPSSDMAVEFTVYKTVSLKKLLEEEPKTEIGHAIGVQGRVTAIGMNKETENVIYLNPVIVKHKDRLAPKRGKELMTEIDPNARSGTSIGPDGKPIVSK